MNLLLKLQHSLSPLSFPPSYPFLLPLPTTLCQLTPRHPHTVLEIHRLERRYTRRAHRSTTWTDSAIYVDGEYVYPTHSSSTVASPSPSPSSTTSTSSSPTTAGYTFDRGGAGARRNGRGEECKRVGEGGSEGRRTWSGRGEKATGPGKRASVGVWVREVVGR